MKSLIHDVQVTARNVSVKDGWIIIRLEDEREIRFPVKKNRRLAHADSSSLGNVQLVCGGTGLHWPDLDEDLSIAGILEGRFGQ